MMSVATIALFLITSAAVVLLWNRYFTPVPVRIAAALWAVCALYQAGTLLTSKVDIPGNLAFVAYPWQASDQHRVNANTGIIFTQIAPWTRIARDAILHGRLPLWNRTAAAGAPLLANQQTAIFHPFTLLGLPLSIGKAFTLSVSLRLFVVIFFMFVMLRQWELGTAAAVFGAVAFTFCTFHVVWLLFPLGLATMMLSPCLAVVYELITRPRPSAYLVSTLALACSVLGGHPESALWVWVTVAAYAGYIALQNATPWPTCIARLAVVGSAFVCAALVTAWFWYPTLAVLRHTERFKVMHVHEANPANHGLSSEWLLPIITPNVLGTPQNNTYTPPRGAHPAVLNDYGEVASSYAGLITLALAVVAPLVVKTRKPALFAFGLMLFSLLTIAEVPLWRDVVRWLPLAGVSLLQRLRVLWDLGVCVAAALTVHVITERQSRGAVVGALSVCATGVLVIYLVRQPSFLGNDHLGIEQMLIPVVSTIVAVAIVRQRVFGFLAAGLVFLDLVVATYHYNPPATPEDVYPVTGAIAQLLKTPPPFRIAAAGWSFLPETPGYYGLEDVKTTDPVQLPQYVRLLRGYLNIEPGSYDQNIRDYSQPFFDYLNIRFVYTPPDTVLTESKFVERYRGADGRLFENTRALPRYFFVRRFEVEPNFDQTVWRSRAIRDYKDLALVDRVPARILREGFAAAGVGGEGTTIRLASYSDNETRLAIENPQWNLLVTSDAAWPGWRAYWNGSRQPTVLVNGAFIGCFIPPGVGTLTLRYWPDEFDLGWRVALVGAVLMVFVAILLRQRVRRFTMLQRRTQA